MTLVEIIIYAVIGFVLNSVTDESDDILIQVYAVISAVLVINRVVSSFDLKGEIEADISPLAGEVSGQRDELELVKSQLVTLGEMIDLSGSAGPDAIRTIIQSYTSITNPKLSEVKDRIASAAANDLERLSFEQRTPILDEPDFYKWLYAEFDSANANTTIRIVSMDENLEWADTHEEKEFWRKNLEAAKRGASITRIFLFDDDRLSEASANPAIKGHGKSSDTGVNGLLVEKTRFLQNSPTAVSEAGQGFIVINEELAIVDVFSSDGLARGYVTFSRTKVAAYLELFKKFSAVARPLDFSELDHRRKAGGPKLEQ